MIKLNEIKEALSNITPGPWREYAPEIDGKINKMYRALDAGRGFLNDEGNGFGIHAYISPVDAHFIANAPEWITSLVSQVEEMQKVLEWYADQGNWKARKRCGNCGDHLENDIDEDSAELDEGERARQALQGGESHE